jgi:hypothetical protein
LTLMEDHRALGRMISPGSERSRDQPPRRDTPGGPITGNRVVPSSWQKPAHGGPMTMAGDTLPPSRSAPAPAATAAAASTPCTPHLVAANRGRRPQNTILQLRTTYPPQAERRVHINSATGSSWSTPPNMAPCCPGGPGATGAPSPRYRDLTLLVSSLVGVDRLREIGGRLTDMKMITVEVESAVTSTAGERGCNLYPVRHSARLRLGHVRDRIGRR